MLQAFGNYCKGWSESCGMKNNILQLDFSYSGCMMTNVNIFIKTFTFLGLENACLKINVDRVV